MAQNANASETYDNKVIREDLQEAYSMISPEETPLQKMARSLSTTNTYKEWPVVELAAPDAANRVVEGESDPGNDAPTLADRFGNYTQISDKVAEVTHTAQAVDAAAENVQRMAKQVVLKMKEMKRDKEWMLLSNIAADAGAADGAGARVAAGLPAWLKTNTVHSGTDPVFSNSDVDGYPTTAAVAGTPAALTEDNLNDVIEACWNEGAEPTIIMVNGGNKRVISATFTGNSTRYKDAIDGKLVAAIDIYDSDFGELTVVPNRFQPTNNEPTATSFNVFVLDPEYLGIAYLDPVQQKPLAETGHSMQTLVWCEYTLQVDNEKAHGVIRDTTNATT